MLEDEFAQAGVSSPADVIECTSIFATLQLVQSSDAIAVLPESVVRDHVGAKLLAPLAIAVGHDLRAFGLLTRKDEPLSEVATAFVGYLKASVAPALSSRRPLRRAAARSSRSGRTT